MGSSTTTSIFNRVEHLPDDPILSVLVEFKNDDRPTKVNLSVGAYRDADGLPFVFTSVRDAEKKLHEDALDMEYLPIEGYAPFNRAIQKLIFGDAVSGSSILTYQTIGATSAIKIGFDFLTHLFHPKVYLPALTWPNHRLIAARIGMPIEIYPYYNTAKNRFDIDACVSELKKIPAGSVVVFQAGCHNPTGSDPTPAEWKILSKIALEGGLIPFFDFAYQGFALDPDSDAFPIRQFYEDGHEFFVSHSCSKSFGLYGERVGSLSIVIRQKQNVTNVDSQIKQLIRSNYSSPPAHGARIVATILETPKFKSEWEHELKNVRDRLIEMRDSLAFGLQTKLQHADYLYITHQKGLFSLLGSTPEEVKKLKEDFGIYMPGSGRINIAGINMHNIDYLLDCFGKVLKK